MAVSYVHYVQPLRVSSKTCLFFSVGGRCREGRRKISVFSKREEANELCRTLEENEGKSRTASEMADVLYRAIVLLTQLHSKM
ncbi:hypothetical protein Q3G72_001453 [Acer saccharum]|nr:hypothetical protein Q3G72_001453 [Acer saccharum]